MAYRDLRAAFLSVGLSRGCDSVQPESERLASQDMSIIVPVKDSPTVVRRCLSSLEKFAPEAEIVIVDDASEANETLDMLQSSCGRNGWTLIRNPRSLGHSRSCEAGWRASSRPYLCFLNSDTVITPWSWAAVKEAFEADPRIGVVGPLTSISTPEQTIRRAMLCRHYWNDNQIFAFARQYLSKVAPKPWMDLPEAGGFAFFIKRDLWERLGGFDPNLPDYGNESELCVRVLKAGMRIVLARGSYIHHLGSQSYGRAGMGLVNKKARAARDYINRKHSVVSS